MGLGEESFYKSTYKKINALFEARIDYIKRSGGAVSESVTGDEAVEMLDKFLG
nr:MAG TPA: hypothetical protein [Caudoviricetes sp.]